MDVAAVFVADLLQFWLEEEWILRMKLLHPLDTHFVEWFEDIHGRKEERTTSTSRIENGHLLQGFIEMEDEQMIFRVMQEVIDKGANVQIISDEIVDVRDLTLLDFMQQGFAALQTVDRFPPDFCGQSESLRCLSVPLRPSLK